MLCRRLRALAVTLFAVFFAYGGLLHPLTMARDAAPHADCHAGSSHAPAQDDLPNSDEPPPPVPMPLGCPLANLPPVPAPASMPSARMADRKVFPLPGSPPLHSIDSGPADPPPRPAA